ncbi:MAG: hypothetical protein ACT4P5_23660 [Armatimonadota bacterium]
MARAVRRSLHDFLYTRRVLAAPITTGEAIAALRARLANRSGTFLEMAERAIFGHPDSPYRPLLDAAGYDLARMKGLVARSGLEETLRTLRRDGVYVSIEEFRGREARRGQRSFRFNEKDFNNPLVASGLSVYSGGTRSRGVQTIIGAAMHRVEAERLAVALSAYGLETLPMVLWSSVGHGASFWGVLSLAAMRNPPVRWFALPEPRAHFRGMRAGARLSRVKLPRVTPVDLGEEHKILEWITKEASAGGCGVITTPSSALRLALAADRSGVRLTNVRFITIAEPLTPTKLAAIHRVGGRAYSSLGFTEFGRATYGCARPGSADDTHVCSDGIAVILQRRPVDRLGTEVDALLCTALQPDARQILLNMETGDYATMTSRRCGCLLEEIGWNVHLENIRSFEKLNSEGPVFWGTQLINLVEEILPARFGGDPTDFQLVEREDEDGFTRLDVLVHPRLGDIDERAVLDCMREALAAQNRSAAAIWEQMRVLRVRRSAPLLTRTGKLMALHRLGIAPVADERDQ